MDKESFAAAQETLRSGLYIVTSSQRRTLAGCTCVWVSRAAFMPPLMSVCLAPTRQTFEVLASSQRFCINVLGDSGLELARRFGFKTGYDADKFEGVAWRKGRSGAPVLDLAVSFFDCRVSQISEIGDHRVVFGEIVEAAVQSPERPAVYIPESFYAGTPQALSANGAAH
jgi:flavin reductase (DIM6/NTAB) family NADH-FMN oxidoreductase RutF